MNAKILLPCLLFAGLGACSCEDPETAHQPACSADADCDGGRCIDGACQADVPDGSTESPDGSTELPDASNRCLEVGQPCAPGEEPACCSGLCRAEAEGGPTVCAEEKLCGPEGAACSAATDCCSLRCAAGACEGERCVQIDGACGEAADCCSGICNGGKCARIPSATCGTLGESCSDDSQCCSKNCQGDRCVHASSCSSAGDICYEALDCCNGSCQLPAGGGPGTCAASVTAPGSPGCTVGGEPCDGDSSCCSRLCTDLGSGRATCVLGTGCRQTGEVCSKNDDCCGWDTSSVVCSLFQTDPPVGRCSNGTACQPVGNCCGAFGAACPQDCCDGKKAVCRLDLGGLARCFGGGDVCPNGYDGLDPNCCIPEGEECQFRDQCCNLAPCVQVDGRFVCQSPKCLAAGQRCTPGATGEGECCNGLECLSSGELAITVCRARPSGGADAGVGSDAGSEEGDGGSGSPDGGVVCSANGESCASGAECCSGACLSGLCGTCKADGVECAAGSDCCSGICSGGRCTPPQTCVNENGTCSGTAECCAGLSCVIAAGQANGTCEPGSTCSASGQACSTAQA
ncbi:MAG: hypothetical protein ACOX6T_18990 [Myxococcales bacterium]|jgi:hypothetical protein